MTESRDGSSFWHAKAAIAKKFSNRRPPVDADTRDSLCKCARGLYLSSCHLEAQRIVLQQHGITHILQVGKELSPTHPSVFSYKTISVYDLEEEDLVKHFPDCFNYINAGRDAGAVLVHCAAGISRSATVVIGYLMATGGLSLDDARAAVKASRPAINPNQGFLLQLQLFQDAGCSAEGWQPWNLERFLQVRSVAYPTTETAAASALVRGACETAPPELSREDSISPCGSPSQSPVRPAAAAAAAGTNAGATAARAGAATSPAAPGVGGSGSSSGVLGPGPGTGTGGCLVSRSRRWLSEAAVGTLAAQAAAGTPEGSVGAGAAATGAAGAAGLAVPGLAHTQWPEQQALPVLPGLRPGVGQAHGGMAAVPKTARLPPPDPLRSLALPAGNALGEGDSSQRPGSELPLAPVDGAYPRQPSTDPAQSAPGVPVPSMNGLPAGHSAATGSTGSGQLESAAAWARAQALVQYSYAEAAAGSGASGPRRSDLAGPSAAGAGSSSRGVDLPGWPAYRQSSPMLSLGNEAGSGRAWSTANGMATGPPGVSTGWRTAFVNSAAAYAAAGGSAAAPAGQWPHGSTFVAPDPVLELAITVGTGFGIGSSAGLGQSVHGPNMVEGPWAATHGSSFAALSAFGAQHPPAVGGRPPLTSLNGVEFGVVSGATSGPGLAGGGLAAGGGFAAAHAVGDALAGNGASESGIGSGMRRHGFLRRSLSDRLPSLLTAELSAALRSPGPSTGGAAVGGGGGGGGGDGATVSLAGRLGDTATGTRGLASGADTRPIGMPRFVPAVPPIAHSPRISTDSGGSHHGPGPASRPPTADGAAAEGEEAEAEPGMDTHSDCHADTSSSSNGPFDSSVVSSACASVGGGVSGGPSEAGSDATPCSGGREGRAGTSSGGGFSSRGTNGPGGQRAGLGGAQLGHSPAKPRRGGALPWALQPILTPAGLERTPSKFPQSPTAGHGVAGDGEGEGGSESGSPLQSYGGAGGNGSLGALLLPASPLGPTAALLRRGRPPIEDAGDGASPAGVHGNGGVGASGGGVGAMGTPPALLSQLLVALALSHSTGMPPYVRSDAGLTYSRANSLGGAAAVPALAADPAAAEGHVGGLSPAAPQAEREHHQQEQQWEREQAAGSHAGGHPGSGSGGVGGIKAGSSSHSAAGRNSCVRASRLATATFADSPTDGTGLDAALGAGGLDTGDGLEGAAVAAAVWGLGPGGTGAAVGSGSRSAASSPSGGRGGNTGFAALGPGYGHPEALDGSDARSQGPAPVLFGRSSAPSAVSMALANPAGDEGPAGDSAAVAAAPQPGGSSPPPAAALTRSLGLPSLRLRPSARSRHAALDASTEGLPGGGSDGTGSSGCPDAPPTVAAAKAQGPKATEGGGSETPIHKRVLRSLTWLLSRGPESPTAAPEAAPQAAGAPGLDPGQNDQQQNGERQDERDGAGPADGTAGTAGTTAEGHHAPWLRPSRRRLWSGAEEGSSAAAAASAAGVPQGPAQPSSATPAAAAAAAEQLAAVLAAAPPAAAGPWGHGAGGNVVLASVREAVSLPPAPSAVAREAVGPRSGWGRPQAMGNRPRSEAGAGAGAGAYVPALPPPPLPPLLTLPPQDLSSDTGELGGTGSSGSGSGLVGAASISRALSRSQSCSPTCVAAGAVATAATAMAGGGLRPLWATSPSSGGSSRPAAPPWASHSPVGRQEAPGGLREPLVSCAAQQEERGLTLQPPDRDAVEPGLCGAGGRSGVFVASPRGAGALDTVQEGGGMAEGEPESEGGGFEGAIFSAPRSGALPATVPAVVLSSEVGIDLDLLPSEPFRWGAEGDEAQVAPSAAAAGTASPVARMLPPGGTGLSSVGTHLRPGTGREGGGAGVGMGVGEGSAGGYAWNALPHADTQLEHLHLPPPPPPPPATARRDASGPRRASSRHFSLDGSGGADFLPGVAPSHDYPYGHGPMTGTGHGSGWGAWASGSQPASPGLKTGFAAAGAGAAGATAEYIASLAAVASAALLAAPSGPVAEASFATAAGREAGDGVRGGGAAAALPQLAAEVAAAGGGGMVRAASVGEAVFAASHVAQNTLVPAGRQPAPGVGGEAAGAATALAAYGATADTARRWPADAWAVVSSDSTSTSAAAATTASRRPRSSYSGALSMLPPGYYSTGAGTGGYLGPVIAGGGGSLSHQGYAERQRPPSLSPGHWQVGSNAHGGLAAGPASWSYASANPAFSSGITAQAQVPYGQGKTVRDGQGPPPVSPISSPLMRGAGHPGAPPALQAQGLHRHQAAYPSASVSPALQAPPALPSPTPQVSVALTSPQADPPDVADGPGGTGRSGGGGGAHEDGYVSLPQGFGTGFSRQLNGFGANVAQPQPSASIQVPPAWGGSRSSAALLTMPSEPSEPSEPDSGAQKNAGPAAVGAAAGPNAAAAVGPAEPAAAVSPGTRATARSTSTGSSATAHDAAAGGSGSAAGWEHGRASRRQLQQHWDAASEATWQQAPLSSPPPPPTASLAAAVLGLVHPPGTVPTAPATAPPTAAPSPVAYGTRRSGGGASSCSANVSPSSAAAAVATALAMTGRASSNGVFQSSRSSLGGVQSPRTPPSMSLDLPDIELVQPPDQACPLAFSESYLPYTPAESAGRATSAGSGISAVLGAQGFAPAGTTLGSAHPSTRGGIGIGGAVIGGGGGGIGPDPSLLRPVISRRLLPMPSPSRITASPAVTPRSGDGHIAMGPALPVHTAAAAASWGGGTAGANGAGAATSPLLRRRSGSGAASAVQGEGSAQVKADLRVLLPHELLPSAAAAAAAAALEAAGAARHGAAFQVLPPRAGLSPVAALGQAPEHEAAGGALGGEAALLGCGANSAVGAGIARNDGGGSGAATPANAPVPPPGVATAASTPSGLHSVGAGTVPGRGISGSGPLGLADAATGADSGGDVGGVAVGELATATAPLASEGPVSGELAGANAAVAAGGVGRLAVPAGSRWSDQQVRSPVGACTSQSNSEDGSGA